MVKCCTPFLGQKVGREAAKSPATATIIPILFLWFLLLAACERRAVPEAKTFSLVQNFFSPMVGLFIVVVYPKHFRLNVVSFLVELFGRIGNR